MLQRYSGVEEADSQMMRGAGSRARSCGEPSLLLAEGGAHGGNVRGRACLRRLTSSQAVTRGGMPTALRQPTAAGPTCVALLHRPAVGL